MAINSNYIIVYDYETGSLSTIDPVPLELAAIVLDGRSLKRVEGATFSTLIKPDDFSKVGKKSLDINHIDLDEVREKGLDEKIAFEQFCKFCKQYSKGTSAWGRALGAGHNIVNFDQPIMESLSRKYGYVDDYGKSKLFHPTLCYDTIHLLNFWFEGQDEPSKYGMDYLRGWFGIKKDGAHRSGKDVEDSADILIRFLTYHRNIQEKHKPKFKGCFA